MLKLETKEILKDLIRIPSYVDKAHDERDMVVFIENFVKANTKYKYIVQDVEGLRKNILVYNKPNPKIALFGHMDTVLPKVETDRLFEPREEGDKLYGLGAVDMKSGLAIMLKLMIEMENHELAFVFSVDEEYDFKGAMKLKEIADFKPEFIINVEPTDGKILNGCRGITEFSFKVHGKSAHAGRKELGVNAIEKTTEMVSVFQNLCSSLDLGDGGKSTVNLAFLRGGLLREDGQIVGMGNVVPNYADVVCEIRVANPKIDKEFVEKKIFGIAENLGVTISDFKFKFYLGAMLTDKASLVELEKAIESAGMVAEYSDVSLAGYYEVQMLQEAWGSKSVVYGAGPNAKSHMADEYVEISSLTRVEKVVVDFIKRVINSIE